MLLYHNDTGGSLPASAVTLDNAKVFQYEAATVDDFDDDKVKGWEKFDFGSGNGVLQSGGWGTDCLLYTSDAADE